MNKREKEAVIILNIEKEVATRTRSKNGVM
jgi:hypothetical protein